MSNGSFVAYYRVSTQQQGRSGLGLEAQRTAVSTYLGDKAKLVAEFVEIETGKGTNALEERPMLRAALDSCKKHGATLLIAKLDRLARNVHFVSGLLEVGCDFVAADMPHATKTMIHIYAAMSEWERDQISSRTKAALAAAKARGVRLGVTGPANLRRNIEGRITAADVFALKLGPTIAGFQSMGRSQRQIADDLNQLGVQAANGGEWSLIQIQRIMKRLARSTAIQVPPHVS